MSKLIITAGLPAAGKSSYLRRANINFPIVDPDSFKEQHPDYDPKDPAPLHEWSKKEARKMQLALLSEERDFVIDGTGTNVEKYAQYINEARELGYTIELHYVKVSLQTALERNAKRERNVPVQILMDKASVIDQTTKIIATMCDDFVVFPND